MKLPLLKKSDLICFTCRKVVCEVTFQYCFPQVYIFCPNCSRSMLREFERQFKSYKLLKAETDDEDGA